MARIRIATLACALPLAAFGRGVSPYLPLHLEPEIERQIERVLILADKPVLRRPIAAATVLDALPRACTVDQVLCQRVRQYLGRYMQTSSVVHVSTEAAATSGSVHVLPNRHGLTTDSSWMVSVATYVQPSDHFLINLGGIAYEDEAVPTGSMLSFGFSRAQLDIGYRTRWLSPLTDSSMLLGTQAPAMPSVTLSNYEPLTRLGLHYELFAARMSRTDRIAFGAGFTAGHPKIAGLHLAMEPVSGWAVGFNRILQYGGGARGGKSVGDVLDAFFSPSSRDNVGPDLSADEQFGNQLAAFSSRFLFPGRTPFALYFEYAGEDTSRGSDMLLGNAALSAGIHFPRLWERFDLAYEVSEWQNAWYVHPIYGEGLRNEGRILGHWGGEERQPGDGVGAQSHLLRLGWEPRTGGLLELRYRTVANESYSTVPYERAHAASVRYSRTWQQFILGGEVLAGRDVLGEDFSRVALFLRYSENPRGAGGPWFDEALVPLEVRGAELFVDAGASASRVRIDLEDAIPRTTTDARWAPHFGIGVRRAVTDRSDLGARIELDDIEGRLLLAVRALDYRYRIVGPLSVGAFLGAARYDLATPAFGLYGGVGVQWRDLLPGWDVGVDLRYGEKIARDNLLPSDPPPVRGDAFYDITSTTLSISRRF